ncbi:hypothetical protein TNCV_1159301 [Trichonephila clavipes]|nr:hypothetical protein TNCV_1159301 [Trichonephila clavipes]
MEVRRRKNIQVAINTQRQEFQQFSRNSMAVNWRSFWCYEDLSKVRERFYWNNVRSDEEKCCGTCDLCAARKGPRKRTRGRLQLYNVNVFRTNSF